MERFLDEQYDDKVKAKTSRYIGLLLYNKKDKIQANNYSYID